LFIHKKLRNMCSSPISRSFFVNITSRCTLGPSSGPRAEVVLQLHPFIIHPISPVGLRNFLNFQFLVSLNIWQHISYNKFKRKMIMFGKNKFFLQAIQLKFLALEQQKGKKDLKSVFHFFRHVFKSQARRRIELPFCV
jgi:hypothetical protein